MPTPESTLRDLNARLDLPTRQRALLIREIRADFEGLVASLVAEGLSTEDAVARAVGMLTPTADDADILAGLHRSWYVRLVTHLQPQRVRVAERTGIAVMAVLAAMAPVYVLWRSTALSATTLVMLGAVSALVLAHLGWQAFRIVVRGDAVAADLARAGLIQVGLVGLTLCAGAMTVALEAYEALEVWAGAEGGTRLAVMASALGAAAGVTALTLGVTILGVFGALALLQWHLSARSMEEELDTLLRTQNQSTRSE
jgi:hypothetical protein